MDEHEIWVEIRPGSDPIAGVVHGGARSAAFDGWLDLVACLQEALEFEAAEAAGDGRPRA